MADAQVRHAHVRSGPRHSAPPSAAPSAPLDRKEEEAMFTQLLHSIQRRLLSARRAEDVNEIADGLRRTLTTCVSSSSSPYFHNTCFIPFCLEEGEKLINSFLRYIVIRQTKWL